MELLHNMTGHCPHIPQDRLDRYAPVACPECGGLVDRDGTVRRPRGAGLAAAVQGVGSILSAVAWFALAALMLLVACAVLFGVVLR